LANAVRFAERLRSRITHTMGDAFEWAWTNCPTAITKTLPSKSVATRNLMAKHILSLAKQGVNDRFRLASEAIWERTN
jgi:hypothetical protein